MGRWKLTESPFEGGNQRVTIGRWKPWRHYMAKVEITVSQLER